MLTIHHQEGSFVTLAPLAAFTRRFFLSFSPSRITPNRLWVAIFSIWLLLLSGLFHGFFGGSPGIFQWVSLQNFLNDRQTELERNQAEIAKLEVDAVALETDRAVQEREIRRVLGYTSKNEIIFDFSLSRSATLRREKAPSK